MRNLGMALFASAAVAGLMGAVSAQDEKAPETPAPMLTPEQVRAIWPTTLKDLAGRYVFAQVASPGGFWERVTPPGGKQIVRQVSINELPASLRSRLLQSELTISDLILPTEVEANQRESPSKRGILRFYSEMAVGRLAMRHLPEIAGAEGDTGTYAGPVLFKIDHQSHSNPSPSGILFQRRRTEPTWGAATLDYADLMALPVPTTPPPAAEDAPGPAAKPQPAKAKAAAPKSAIGTPKAPKPAAAPVKPMAVEPRLRPENAHAEEPEERQVITNARITRGGGDIFAYIEWEGKSARGRQQINGVVRLARQDDPPPPAGEQDMAIRP